MPARSCLPPVKSVFDCVRYHGITVIRDLEAVSIQVSEGHGRPTGTDMDPPIPVETSRTCGAGH